MNLKRNTELKIEDGKLYQRTRQSVERTNIGECPFCDIPVYVSSGQLITTFNGKPTHKICRKEYEKSGKLRS